MAKEERLERRSAASRAAYQRNKEKILAKHREWRQNNPEKMRELNAAWYWQNHEKALSARAAYRSAHREKMRQQIRTWYEKNKRRVLDAARLKKTGCTPEEYSRLFNEQHGVCAICQRPPGKHALSADHCHRNSRVRGLLCHRCNTVLGLVSDNAVVLQAAISYLT